MSRNNEPDVNPILTLAVWSMLMLLMLQQCSHQDYIERELRDIKHEIRMLKFTNN